MTRQEARRIETMWMDGVQCVAIAEELGMPPKDVYEYVRTHGSIFGTSRYKRYSSHLRDAIVRKIERGMPAYKAEETYGIHESLLEEWLLESKES